MKINSLLLYTSFCLLLLFPGTALAEDPFHVNGYLFTNVGFHQRGKTLQCTGRISGGKFCEKLVVRIQARSDRGQITTFRDTIERAGTRGAIFKDIKSHIRGKERAWKVLNVQTFCMK